MADGVSDRINEPLGHRLVLFTKRGFAVCGLAEHRAWQLVQIFGPWGDGSEERAGKEYQEWQVVPSPRPEKTGERPQEQDSPVTRLLLPATDSVRWADENLTPL